MVPYRHRVTGQVVYVARDPGDEWERVRPVEDRPDPLGPFDPAMHSADEVAAYLASAPPAERARVLARERSSRARVALVGRAGQDVPPMAEATGEVDGGGSNHRSGGLPRPGADSAEVPGASGPDH